MIWVSSIVLICNVGGAGLMARYGLPSAVPLIGREESDDSHPRDAWARHVRDQHCGADHRRDHQRFALRRVTAPAGCPARQRTETFVVSRFMSVV